MDILSLLESCTGFEWDEGNTFKNQMKHSVSLKEAEEVFINDPKIFFYDTVHSQDEERFGVLGRTLLGRELSVFFTVRSEKIRIISARDQHRVKEQKRYIKAKEEYEKQNK